MKRGDLYRVLKGRGYDPRKSRVFVVVSRQALIDSKFSTVICAPVYSVRHGLSTQIDIGIDEGVKTDSCIHCDELISLEKSRLKSFVGTLPPSKLSRLEQALRIALAID